VICAELFDPVKLLQPPFPFFCVDSSQPLICALRFCEIWDAPERCSTKQNGGFFPISSCLAQQTRARKQRISLIYAAIWGTIGRELERVAVLSAPPELQLDRRSSFCLSETRSPPALTRSYPRHLTFYVADPHSSIRRRKQKRQPQKARARWWAWVCV
jgi:hypothetical protein